jgi:hypothetical protein
MIKRLLVLLILSPYSILQAQTIKTDVLVIGGSPSGVAAAMQCARSKVKTVLAAENISLGKAIPETGMLSIDANKNIPSGAWGEFVTHVHDFYKNTNGYDTAKSAQVKFEKAAAEGVLKKMTDTLKNLTVYLNTAFISIKKDDDRWDVKITRDGKTLDIKAKVIIDATESGVITAEAGGKIWEMAWPVAGNERYRTSIAAGDKWPAGGEKEKAGVINYPQKPSWYIPMNAVLPRETDNFMATESILPGSRSADYLPIELELGQGVGAMAAYCVFFKTNTKNLKVRIIQGEILDFKGYLLPLTDINPGDPDWRAIQQVCATGLLKGADKSGRFVFDADAPVTTAEIEPVLKEIYTRAFLWFNQEKPGEKFTIANTLSFISDYTLTDPVILKGSIQKEWKTKYKFEKDFDVKRQITRREFAVLANRYLNPFARTVDLEGRLVN